MSTIRPAHFGFYKQLLVKQPEVQCSTSRLVCRERSHNKQRNEIISNLREKKSYSLAINT